MIADVVDALRELLEPASAIEDDRSMNGVMLDRSLAQPFDHEPNTLYGWAENVTEISAGTGEIRQNFVLLFVFTAKASEEAGGQRDREISLALDAKAGAYLKLVRDFANIPPWDAGNIQASVDNDLIRQLQIRGVGLRVTGYRMVTGQ